MSILLMTPRKHRVCTRGSLSIDNPIQERFREHCFETFPMNFLRQRRGKSLRRRDATRLMKFFTLLPADEGEETL